MSQVKPNYYPNNIKFVVENGEACPPTMMFDPRRSLPCQAKPPQFNAGEPLEDAMVDFDQSNSGRQVSALRFEPKQVIGRSKVRVAMSFNCLKCSGPTVPLQTCCFNRQSTACWLRTNAQTNLTIACQLGQPIPTEGAHQLQILQAAIPTVKGDRTRLKTTLLSLLKQGVDMLVFVQSITCLVVFAIAARQAGVCIDPNQTNQVTQHPFLMLARPMAAHHCHCVSIGFIQGYIISHQHPTADHDTRMNFSHSASLPRSSCCSRRV